MADRIIELWHTRSPNGEKQKLPRDSGVYNWPMTVEVIEFALEIFAAITHQRFIELRPGNPDRLSDWVIYRRADLFKK
ncbi:MAG: hypothetical protein ACOZBH_03785 [Patescibacteria group bacterium]